MSAPTSCVEVAEKIASYIIDLIRKVHLVYNVFSTINTKMLMAKREKLTVTVMLRHDILVPLSGVELYLELLEEEVADLPYSCRSPTAVNMIIIQSIRTDTLSYILGSVRRLISTIRLLADKDELTLEDVSYARRLIADTIKEIGERTGIMLDKVIEKLGRV